MADLIWCEIRTEIPTEMFEIVADIFQDYGSGGVVMEDPSILDSRELQYDEVIDDKTRQNAAKVPAIKAYFPLDERLPDKLAEIRLKLASVLGKMPIFETLNLNEADWANAWKAYYKPEHIGKVVIKPSWETYEQQDTEVVVELDPGMAFGTGTHPTTRLCLQTMQELIEPHSQVLDLGTGSGILAITAAKLGAATVVASDVDPVAVRVTEENVQLNGVSDKITVFEGDLLEKIDAGEYDLVTANIIADIILRLIPRLNRVVKRDSGRFVASGIIETRLDDVVSLLESHGFEVVKIVSEQEWRAIIAKLVR